MKKCVLFEKKTVFLLSRVGHVICVCFHFSIWEFKHSVEFTTHREEQMVASQIIYTFRFLVLILYCLTSETQPRKMMSASVSTLLNGAIFISWTS